MTRRTWNGRLGLVVALVLILTACGGRGGTDKAAGQGGLAGMDPITLAYILDVSADSPGGRAVMAFAEELAEKSGGKITVEPYFSGSFVPGTEALQAVGDGVAQLATYTIAYDPQKLPINNWLVSMGSMPSNGYPHGMLAGSAALMQLQQTQEILKQEWADHNIKLLTAFQLDVGYNLLCTKPVDSTATTSGLRVRTGGGAWIEEIEALGAIPVQMPILETYEGLQRGVIDCLTSTPSTNITFGLWEVAKHYTPLSMSAFNGGVVLLNLDVWESLPPEGQRILQEAAHTLWATDREETMKSFARFGTEGPTQHGVVFHDPAPLDTVLQQHQARVVAELVTDSPPGVGDPQGFIREYHRLLDEWGQKTATTLDTPEQPRNPEAVRESYSSALNLNYSKFDELTRTELFGATR